MSDRISALCARLEEGLTPVLLEITDDSHKHVGHVGARDGRGHFSVRIHSPIFHGMSPLARHRAVYSALGELMQTDIHALAIDARAPEENA